MHAGSDYFFNAITKGVIGKEENRGKAINLSFPSLFCPKKPQQNNKIKVSKVSVESGLLLAYYFSSSLPNLTATINHYNHQVIIETREKTGPSALSQPTCRLLVRM